MTDTKMCPYCGEDIKIEAIKCKHCQSMLSKEDDELVGAATKRTDTADKRALKTKKPIWKRWWVWAIGIVVLFMILISGGGKDEQDLTTKAGTETPADTGSATEDSIPEPEPENTVKTYAAGTYLVNQDIEPGRYRSDGGISYWERLSGLSGELGDILANSALHSGILYVDIQSSDLAFSFNGSGKLYLVDDSFVGELLTSFGDGVYWVGKDIEPGRYRSNTAPQYWARLSNFSGNLNAILANDAMAQGSVIVDIKASDVGFETRGAQWEKVD
jgi:hypothetical protein